MSNSNTHPRAPNRPYRLGKRAEKKDATRRRIVQAAVELHSTIGPAQTTVAQIAERAGVQRHTYYAHFPTEWDLIQACSGLALERDPLPVVHDLAALPSGKERIRVGLTRFYEWFERNSEMAACVLRDAEHHELTREIVKLRMAPAFGAASDLLSEGLGNGQRALLQVSLGFPCWRTLGQSHTPAEAATLMSEAITLLTK